MIDRVLFFAARILIPSVFVGLGLERLSIFGGIVAGPPSPPARPRSASSSSSPDCSS
ncbi:MAG TPA: hypothetical protein VLD36_06795 [Burkholderiales bacterium]|jgi:hypothetical protein|nr:hypothetical protein [Burkholderiales bacterium]